MRKLQEIEVVEKTVNKKSASGLKERTEKWFANLLFQDWLERKGLKKRMSPPNKVEQ